MSGGRGRILRGTIGIGISLVSLALVFRQIDVASVAQVLSSLRGTAKVALANGEVTGLDLEQALRRLEKRPLSIASDMRSGRTAFSEAQLDLDIAGGMAKVVTLEARGAGVDISVTGSASIARRSSALIVVPICSIASASALVSPPSPRP